MSDSSRTSEQTARDTSIYHSDSIFRLSNQYTYTFLYSLAHLLLFLGALAFDNILDFSIEDAYEQDAIPSLFFGYEYAVSISWVLVTTFTYILIMIFLKKSSQQYLILFQNRTRLRALNFFIGLCAFIAFFYVLKIVYSYFSGNSDPIGLFRILTTCTLLAFGALYAFIESRYFAFSKNIFYLLGLFGCIIFADILSVHLTLKYASPHLIKLYGRDYDRITTLESMAQAIRKYYENFGALPATISKVEDFGLFRVNSNNNDFTYTVVTSRSFDVCTTFEADSTAARRLYGRRGTFSYSFKKGPQCERFFIEKDQEGKLFLKTEPQSNISIHVNNY